MNLVNFVSGHTCNAFLDEEPLMRLLCGCGSSAGAVAFSVLAAPLVAHTSAKLSYQSAMLTVGFICMSTILILTPTLATFRNFQIPCRGSS